MAVQTYVPAAAGDFSAIAVGLLAGLSSVILKNLTHLIQSFVEETLVGKMGFNGFYFAFPVIGIALTLLVIRYVVRREVGHGIPNVLYAISRGKSLMWYGRCTLRSSRPPLRWASADRPVWKARRWARARR